jgi:predicted ATPase/DNA-binding winged helix-turn-helix (wHTH) protein
MIQLGHLRVHLDTREVFSGGQPVRIGSRAFDILEVLIEADGALVSKQDLLKQVWPNTVVAENNLQVHMSTLRKLLGDGPATIRTVPRRGYRLLRANASGERMDIGAAPVIETNLPSTVAELIGREEAIDHLVRLLQVERHVTLVGAGGIGKTSLGIAVARRVLERFPDGVYLVQLASATDAKSVVDVFGKAIGAEPESGPITSARLIGELEGRRVLVVLDNCEHVQQHAAELAMAVTLCNPEASILATSREPLRIPGEFLYRVASLKVPDSGEEGHEVLQRSAVRLFLARARAIDPKFSSDEQSVFLTGTVCRRLDGIPLAIELAAARAAMLGIHTIATHLDDRFRLLTGGNRTALPRHQTLRATLDWSYELLNDTERTLLRRLGVFVEGFTQEAASAVVGIGVMSSDEVAELLACLVSKSWVVAAAGDGNDRCRLLETTRAYALQKLEDHGELRSVSLRHAAYLRGRFDRTRAALQCAHLDVWHLQRERELADMRVALAWALGPQGDEQAGIELAAVAVDYFFDVSLVQECAAWARLALAVPRLATPLTRSDAHLRMQLLAGLGAALAYVEGPAKETHEVWAVVMSTAIALGDRHFEARALWGLFFVAQSAGAANEALAIAERFCSLAEDMKDGAQSILGRRLRGIALHYAGRQRQARAQLTLMLAQYERSRHRLPMLGLTVDHGVVGRATLARMLWLKGQRDEALSIAEDAVEAAYAQGHAMAACYVLVEALIPLSLLSERREGASRGIALLDETSSRAGFNVWQACGRVFRTYMHSMCNVEAQSLCAFSKSLDEVDARGYRAHHSMLEGQYALALARAGRTEEGIETVERTLARCDETGEAWYSGELLRIKGELLTMRATEGSSDERSSFDDAERCFSAALVDAVTQGSLTFQLRAAISLSRLWQAQGRADEIVPLLRPICAQFSQGLDFSDFLAAQDLLASINRSETGDVDAGVAAAPVPGARRSRSLTPR